LSRLPGILGEIADVAGEVAALKLAQARGGTEMKISGRAGGVLAQIVGDEAAAKIAELLGPEKYTIPMASVRGRAARQAALAKAMAEGTSSNAAALQHDVHERTARRARRKLKEGPGPLFER
jgi:hypothetical protein